MVSVKECQELASNKDGYFLSNEYIKSNYNYFWQCKRGHIWKATHSNVKRGTWCPYCSKNKINWQTCQELAKKYNGHFLSKNFVDSKSKYIWKCKFDHKWEESYKRVKEGRWCPQCTYNKTHLTINHCHKLAKQNNGKCLSKNYIDSNTKYLWQCKYGHQWPAMYRKIYEGRWCPYCAGKLTLAKCQALAKNKSGKFLSTNIKTVRTKYIWQCAHNHQWKATYESIKAGTWCPYCCHSGIISLEDCINLASKFDGYFLSKKYINAKHQYTWQCNLGHTWQTNYDYVQRGRWCPQCRDIVSSIEDCKKLALEKEGRFLSKNFTKAVDKHLWQCKFGHRWKQSPSVIKQGSWCPKCRTKIQTFIFNICKKIYPQYDIKYNFRDFDWLKTKTGHKMEIDIYLPELKLAIEYDGEQHFEPVQFGTLTWEEAVNKLDLQRKRDLIKNEKIKNNSQDINYFIRFNCFEDLTEEYIKNKIRDIING